jgi:hypothetical protein
MTPIWRLLARELKGWILGCSGWTIFNDGASVKPLPRLSQNPNTRRADDTEVTVMASRKLGQFFGPYWVRKASNETSAKQRKQEDNASQAKDSFDLDKSIDRCGTERDRKGRS